MSEVITKESFNEEYVVTEEDIKEALPKHLARSIPSGLVNDINKLIQKDEILRAGLRNNILGYASVLSTGKFKIKEYVNAVRYCTYRLSGKGILESYKLAFPDRYKRLVDQGTELKNISAMATVYNKGKLVTAIMEQAMVPTWLLNQDLYQEALNSQAKLMREANSEMVRMKAADSILNQLKVPDTAQIEVNMTTNSNDNGVIDELRKITQELASTQHQAIVQGQVNVIDIAKSSIVAVEDKSNEE